MPEPPRPPSEDPLPPLTDVRLRAYLPMIYVAWADGDLTPAETRAIRERLRSAGDLDGETRACLDGWLDSARQPTARQLQGLLRTIREAAPSLSRRERRNLTEVGLELARAGGHEPGTAERGALMELEKTLGLGGSEAAGRLLAEVLPAEKAPELPAEPPPAFDVEAMTRLLDGDQREIRQRVRRLLAEPELATGASHRLDRRSYREQVLAGCRRLADEGLGALSYPHASGGSGDVAAFIAVFETLAFGDLSLLVKFGVQFGLFGGSIFQLGSERHHRRYLPAVGTLELPGCFAMTETGHGSNVYDLETRAVFDRERDVFVVETPNRAAYKDYIGNAALHGRLATVFAQLEIDGEGYGVHALLVPIRGEDGQPLPGVTIEDCGPKMGLEGVDNGRLAFDRVAVPRENLLDRFAQVDADGTYHSAIASPSKRFFTMLGTLVGGRVSVALGGLSVAKTALAIAVRYGVKRRQFGPPGGTEMVILDYLAHQRRLLPRLANAYALDFALSHLARRYVASTDEDRREVETLAAGLKAFSTWNATDTVQTCREACGGQGYLAENRFADLKADSDVFTTFEGDNTVLLQLVAKGLLSGYRQQFSSMNLLGLVRFVAERAGNALVERNPAIVRNTDPAHLRGRDFQLGALRWREEHLLTTVARRIKKRIDGGMDSYLAVLDCQDHVLSLARAHVERLVLEQFAEGVDACEDDDLRTLLDSLCSLFALWRIELDRGWFQENGFLEDAKAKAVRKQVICLCRELRPQALHLVDAFGIPDAVLAAPIALES